MQKNEGSRKPIQKLEIPKELLENLKHEEPVSFVKKCIIITGCIAALVVMIMLCIMLHKNNFSMESLISLLLAFFSIFMSVFFYFKADEASNRFYETSYGFMKDVSVTLGKIEERFSEKLNSLNEQVSRMSVVSAEKNTELKNEQDEKQKIIDDLMDKAKLSEQQKQEYQSKLQTQDQKISDLQHQIHRLRQNEMMYTHYRDVLSFDPDEIKFKFSPREISIMQNMPQEKWPMSLRKKARNLDLIDDDGDITLNGRDFMMSL